MTDAPWLSPEQLAAWVRFVSVVERLPAVLDSELQRAADVTHFEYMVLAMLSDAPERTLRMSALAVATSSTLPRLSHVVSRLEARSFVQRSPRPEDRRATNARLTDAGLGKLVAIAPGHVRTVRDVVFDGLAAEQVRQLGEISGIILSRLASPTVAVNPSSPIGRRA